MTAAADDALLQLRGIGKTFTGVAALRDINLTVRAGRVHTLLGENGAGKSTLIKILAGVHQPSGGSMMLSGAPYAPASPREAAARGIAVVFQELSLCNNLTVAENILATRKGSDVLRPDFGSNWFDYVDYPEDEFIPNTVREVILAIQTWEKRALVEQVTFSGHAPHITMTVHWRVADEVAGEIYRTDIVLEAT
ncbi:MAG: ATP-binding cassette domain-containing protein [Cardiobacterium sp.]